MNLKVFKYLVINCLILFCATCVSSLNTKRSALECVNQVMTTDEELGRIRNNACKTISLEQTILDYVREMKKLDYSGCPIEFSTAFQNHQKAWFDLIPFVKKYNELRGEMHDVFKQIEEGEKGEEFKKIVKKVWDTWAEVEKAIDKEKIKE